ncbi:MAG: cache domain-containing protein [Balneolales bacterium]|nr:cache domain-containing protein [Balneolales bacterium]
MSTIRNLTSILLIAVFISFAACNVNDSNDDEERISLFDLNKEIVEFNVNSTATGLGSAFTTMATDSALRAQLSQTYVSESTFFPDGSGYFFIETLDSAYVIAHLNESLIGTKRYFAQDLNGKFHVQEIINTVNTSGSGFVEYFFTNPASGNGEDKLSYVTSLPPTNWFIGAGFYYTEETRNTMYTINEANEIVVQDLVETNARGFAEVFSSMYTNEEARIAFSQAFVDDITFFEDESGYFFIVNFEGMIIAHGTQEELEGENNWDLQDSQGTYIVRDMSSIAQSSAGSGFYEYYWPNPATGDDELKKSFVMTIPGTEYFIAAGVYEGNR